MLFQDLREFSELTLTFFQILDLSFSRVIKKKINK